MFQVVAQVDTQGLGNVIFALQAIGENRLPATAMAVRDSAEAVQRRWIQNTKGAGFRYSKGDYLQGITEGMVYPYQGSVYSGAVINLALSASWIEHGTAPHDMKKMLFTSAKVRISAKGKRYLIIPFRHGTPSAGSHEGGLGESRATLRTMPKAVYAMAKTLTRSRQLSAYKVQSANRGKGMAVRYTYRWAGKLTQGDLEAAGLGKTNRRPHWKASPYAGMVRFPAHENTGQSTYMTFRVMHEDSNGWLHPGTAPRKLAEMTANQMEPVVRQIIGEGFNADMVNMLGQT